MERRFLPTMVLNYTSKNIESYRSTLVFCKIKPPSEIAEKFKITDFNELSIADFFSIIHDPNIYSQIDAQLSDFPSVQFHLNKFANQTKTAADILKFLNRHEQNFKWHINRLYRIRCDIVHSAEYSLNLTLLCANLEFYLKALLSIVFDQLNRNLLIASLNEIYERMNHAYSLLMASLKAGNLDFHQSILKGEAI